MEREVINEIEIDKDGIVYIQKTYDDGYTEYTLKEGYENAITNTAQRQLDLETNVQYLVDLAEINMEE